MEKRIRIPPSRWLTHTARGKNPSPRVGTRRAWLDYPNEQMRTRARRQTGHDRCQMGRAVDKLPDAFHVGTIVQLVSQRRKRAKTSALLTNSAPPTPLHT